MSYDNREYVFLALVAAFKSGHQVGDKETRQEVIEVFEYVLAYYSEWFSKSAVHEALRLSWQLGSVIRCRCFTDDAFTMSSTIATLLEVLDAMEAYDANDDSEDEANAQIKREMKKEEKVKTE